MRAAGFGSLGLDLVRASIDPGASHLSLKLPFLPAEEAVSTKANPS